MSDPQQNSDDEATLPTLGSQSLSELPAPPTKSNTATHLPEFLGRYRVERLLAVGGFGSVFRAWDEELKRTVAIKLIRSELITPEYPRPTLATDHPLQRQQPTRILPLRNLLSTHTRLPCSFNPRMVNST